MRLLTRYTLFQEVQPLFEGGIGTHQFNLIIAAAPRVDLPGRKHPLYDYDTFLAWLESFVQPVTVVAEKPSLHRRRGRPVAPPHVYKRSA